LIALYHVKAEGYNPLKWRMRPSEDLREPLSVAERDPRERRGNLSLEYKGGYFTKQNTWKVGEWLWTWVK
jgi:hypothetical protein